METTQLAGILAPAVTAFNEQLEIDAERTVAHFQWLLKEGCDALVVFGTTSEANSLSVAERTRFLESAIAKGIDPRKLLPGTGCCSLPDSVELTQHAMGLGCPAVLMLPPFYYKAVSDEGLFRYFATLIERVKDDRLRIYLYHIPPVSQISISLDLIERLTTEFPEIVIGIKDSSGDWENTRRVIERFAPKGFRVFPGSELYLLPALRMGGKGCISAFANINPGLLQKVFQNWQGPDGDGLQQEAERQGRALRKYPVIPALKATLAEWYKDPGWENIRPPLVALSAEQRERLLAEAGRVEIANSR
jgi:4-hydroxy-tetrahydrodipicolinate synthase